MNTIIYGSMEPRVCTSPAGAISAGAYDRIGLKGSQSLLRLSFGSHLLKAGLGRLLDCRPLSKLLNPLSEVWIIFLDIRLKIGDDGLDALQEPVPGADARQQRSLSSYSLLKKKMH